MDSVKYKVDRSLDQVIVEGIWLANFRLETIAAIVADLLNAWGGNVLWDENAGIVQIAMCAEYCEAAYGTEETVEAFVVAGVSLDALIKAKAFYADFIAEGQD